MKTIDDYRAQCRILLGDEAGRRYSDAMIDMGFREALGIYGSYLPRIEEVQTRISAYENNAAVIPWAFPDPMMVLGMRRNSSKDEMLFSLKTQPGKLYVNFHEPVRPSVGEQLQIEMSVPHSIKGLDDANRTTVPDPYMTVMCKGAAGYAMRIRARSVTEVFGKRPEDREALMIQADDLVIEFLNELKQISLVESYNKNPWPVSNLSLSI